MNEEEFLADVKNHQMKVYRDDGVYRHILFRAPDMNHQWFELVTWPGALMIRGDMGDFAFSRVSDMFTFFNGNVNPQYWGEKVIAAPRGETKAFSESSFREQVTQYVEEWIEDNIDEWIESREGHTDLDGRPLDGNRFVTDVLQEVEDQIFLPFEDCPSNEKAQELLDWFDEYGLRFYDTWEWDFHEHTVQFLWCLHAIKWGIEQYRESRNAMRQSILKELANV